MLRQMSDRPQPRSGRWWVPCVVLLATASCVRAQGTETRLAGIFGDHAVLQRSVPVPVWGSAAPGEQVTVEIAGAVASAVTDDSGQWTLRLPALSAGGPYVLSVRSGGGGTVEVSDVMVGDVFLCSGQSNMALPVSRSVMGGFEAMRSADTRIRMLTVPNVSSPTPLGEFTVPVAWEVASPETVANWSAACYYFGRDLRSGPLAVDDVPVGMITAAWGGSGIEPWMAGPTLRSVGGYDAALEMLDVYPVDEQKAQMGFGGVWQAWWLGKTKGDPDAAPWTSKAGREWAPAPEGLGDWTRWTDLGGFTGMVWFRATVDLTEERASRDATLALGAVDEVDQTWLNGRIVGNTFGYGTERVYRIPAELLEEGENVLVVNVLNTYASGGLTGDHEVRSLRWTDGTRLPMEDWRYHPVREMEGTPPRAPWESVGGLSTIHNAMVAPLRDYGLRGVAWYQGESNTGDGARYGTLLRALMAQWRAEFVHPGRGRSDLPVLVVQLPNYGRWQAVPTESGWAEVRDAQRRATLDDPSTALVVTVDVGDPRDLHPANKQAVGARLARAARSVVYGEPIPSSGPVPVRADRRGDQVVVSFDGVDDTLVAFGGAGPIGFELCGASSESCRYADARVAGRQVLVRIDGDDPVTRVRHAWADSPIVTLFDGSGLPVGTFELPVQQDR